MSVKVCKRGHAERYADGRCIECSRARHRAWKASNPEKMAASKRNWRVNNPEIARASEKRRRDETRGVVRARDRDWYAANPDKVRAYRWKSRGLPSPTRPAPETCECCGDTQGQMNIRHGAGYAKKRATTYKLALDHDHVTGKFRGWLCTNCNTAIGKLGDDIAGLERAIAYLRRVA